MLLGVLAGVFFAARAGALSLEDTGASIGLGTADLVDTIVNVINWALGLIGLVGVVMVLYGGYLWLTAAGNVDRITRAKKILINAVIGLAIILFAWAIVNYVLKLGQDVTGGPGGGDTCVLGEERGCYDCGSDNTFSVYDPSNEGCTLPQDTFEIRSITTSCVSGTDFRDDVYRCSGVSVNFNKTVSAASVEPRVLDDALTVEQCGEGSTLEACLSPSQPTPLFNAVPPAENQITYAGSVPKGTEAEIVVAGKSFSFLHQHELFPANTFFRLTVPKTITDATTGKALSACRSANGAQIPGCVDTGANFQWIFRVGTETDSVAPTAEAAYPGLSNATGYPDRNVNRNAILWLTYDEPVAPWTMTSDNVSIVPYTTPPNDDGTGGVLGTPLASSDYRVIGNDRGTGFELNFNAPFQLDAFTWYQVQVAGVQDLCTNTQAPDPITWSFQTNGTGAGIAERYPADGYAYSCPATQTYVLFNSSMYDPATGSCAVIPESPDGGGFVTGGTLTPANTRNPLQVEDDLPADRGEGFNPNNYCKKYSWRPTTQQLAADTQYTASVTTRYPIDQNGGTLNTSWSFSTKAPDACANPPAIERISPPSGAAGRCLSVLGNALDKVPTVGQEPGDALTFSTPSNGVYTVPAGDIPTWSETTLVTNAPDLGSVPENFSSAVRVTVNYPAPIGPLTSAVHANSQFVYQPGSYDGPCLTALNPSAGYRTNAFDFTGERFNPDSVTQKVHFDGGLACGGPICWASDTNGRTNVPADTEENVYSDVAVENDKGTSNAVRYFVNRMLPGTFHVRTFAPSCGGSVSCTNADVLAQFSETPKAELVNSSTFQLFRCADASCAESGLTQITAEATLGSNDTVHFPPASGLDSGTWYRAVVRGGSTGILSVTGKELGQLNDDGSDADTEYDAFSWVFGTTAGATVCRLQSVQCSPGTSSLAVGGTTLLAGSAFSAPNQCNGGGTQLDATDYAWTWASDQPLNVSVSPAATAVGDPATTTATGLAGTPPGDPANVTAATEGHSAQCSVIVANNSCQSDADCVNNAAYGGTNACPGSVCNQTTNTCSPSVRSILPASGPVGKWITLAGCYFGETRGDALFLQGDGPDRLGLFPAPEACQSGLWTDRQIIVEVPNKRTSSTDDDVTANGALRVRRPDGSSGDSADQFTITNEPVGPNLCRISPQQGKAGVDRVTLQGELFDDPPGRGAAEWTDFSTQHRVTFFNNQSVAASTENWTSDEKVENVTVPQFAANKTTDDQLEVTVTTPRGTSNPVNFDVISTSCTVCTNDSQCGGTQACVSQGSYACCANRPEAYAPSPSDGTENVCRNAVMNAAFRDATTKQPIAMVRSTINASTVTLEKKSAGSTTFEAVALTDSQFSFPSSSTFTLKPGLLERNATYRATITNRVQATSGTRPAAPFLWSFTTADSENTCLVDRVALTPSTLLFTRLTAAAQLTASAYSDTNIEIDPLFGSYGWEWTWASGQPGVATVSADTFRGTDDRDHVRNIQTVTAVANGETSVSATLTDDQRRTFKASAAVDVTACSSAWPALPDDPEAPYEPYTDNVTNFSTWYCRDDGRSVCRDDESTSCTTDAECGGGACLWSNVVVAAGGGIDDGKTETDDLLRQVFFEYPVANQETHKKDAVGILVWENKEHRSPRAWYEHVFGQSVNAAAFTVDGYEAMRVGTTVYIAGTNVTGDQKLYTNMYVLSYNPDAGPDMTNIFNQVLEHFALNVNNFDYGSADRVAALGYLRTDTKRYADLQDLAGNLRAYNAATGSFPTLAAGSYLGNFSTSAWPSWRETFGSDLQSKVQGAALPTDPVNAFDPKDANTGLACPAGFEQPTCWNEQAKTFFCPPDGGAALTPDGSHLYAYQYQPSAGQCEGTTTQCTSDEDCGGARCVVQPSYNLFSHFDFDGAPAGNWQENRQNPCSGDSQCACFNFSIFGQSEHADVQDTQPPSIPQNLRVTGFTDVDASLSWLASNDYGGSGVQYYRIYRSVNGGATYAALPDRVAHPTTVLTDTALNASTTYFYKISAVDAADHESALSSPVSVTTNRGPDVLPPGPVREVGVTLQAEPLAAVLTWLNPSDADFIGVKVLRKNGEAFGFTVHDASATLVKQTDAAETRLTDATVVDQRTYTYGLFALDGADNSAPGIYVVTNVRTPPPNPE